MHVLQWPCATRPCVIRLEGPLRIPLDGTLRRRVRALLGRGTRTIVLNLERVPSIDAAGVGELVRAYNATHAAGGDLRIVHLSAECPSGRRRGCTPRTASGSGRASGGPGCYG